MFTHPASHRAALLFSHHFHTAVPTSYSTVLHCPGAHSSNCVKFMHHGSACTLVRMCVPVWSCKRLFCIRLPYLCVHASLCNAPNMNKLHLRDQKSSCKRLQRLFLNDYFYTCSFTEGDIIIAFSTFISFDIGLEGRCKDVIQREQQLIRSS